MLDIATSITTALNRAIVGISDDVAKLGLQALKESLDDAGFQKMDLLKNYEVYSHVSGNTILFEIVLDVGAVEDLPEETLNSALQSAEILESEIDNLVMRSYGISAGGDVFRLSRMRDVRIPSRDARSPARDARRPARDARRPAGRGAEARKIDHAVAKVAPRSLAGMRGIRVTKEGKISLAFEKTVSKTEEGEIKYPEGKFDGVMKDFMDRLQQVVLKSFAPELKRILERHFK